MTKQPTRRMQKRAIELIQQSDAVFLGTHVRPDGDALGCLLGMAIALESTGCRVARLCADPAPENYRFLPGTERLSSVPPAWVARLGIVVDCDGLSRVGPLESAFAALPDLIDIDHHATDQAFGDVRLVDPTAGATGEIVHELLCRAGLPLDADTATCLYTAIVTDTGRFGYANTSARSLSIATELVKAGADPHLVARKVYEERSIGATHLLGVALSRLSADFDDEVVSSTLKLDDFVRLAASASDTEGIIDHLRAIGGTRVALLLVETEDSQVRVSLRSDGTLDVSRIALTFGGGGHPAAAGCTIAGTTDSVKELVLSAVSRSLSRSGPPDAD